MEKETIIKILDFIEKKENKLSSKSSKFINKIKFIERLESGIPFTKEELNIKGNLYLDETQITYLPEGLKVGGDLNLENCKNLTSLPEGLKVSGNLDLSNSNITSLPKGLEVGGDLYLRNSNITTLSEGLKVGGDMDLDGCREITSLPEGLEVGGNLDLNKTTIKSLPEGLKVGGDLFARCAVLNDYTKKELQEMIKTGFIKGRYYRK